MLGCAVGKEKLKNVMGLLVAVAVTAPMSLATADLPRIYELWEPAPAPNRGRVNWERTKGSPKPNSYDQDWERWSYPLGNGYGGACVFGRTDTDRIQITEKTLHNKGKYGKGGLTGFAEIFLDFNHGEVQEYRRSLSLNEAIARVSYEHDGVRFQREYFASYPDKVTVVQLTADKKGELAFNVRVDIPYLERKERTGIVTAAGSVVTFKGTVPRFSCNYEGQVKVLNEGGTVTADKAKGALCVNGADSVTLLIATGTNYVLEPKTFLAEGPQKLDPQEFPHEKVTACVDAAESLGYAALKQRHRDDYQNLFGRVSVNLNSTPSSKPTHELLEHYQQGDTDPWLEELMFQYGRYLLIASSRPKSLPANLQGAWSQDYFTPWTGGFWHNINVQMNYWGAMNTNLAECFESYIHFYQAYLPIAQRHAADYVREHTPDGFSEQADNGWVIGTGANAYYIPGSKGGHSGPGTGGFTAKLLADYYHFTQDHQYLAEVAFPAMLSLCKFYSKALVPHGDLLLIEPSSSPEQTATPEQVKGLPGRLVAKRFYTTAGCTFDQGFVWETYADTLALAEALGRDDRFLATIREQIPHLDPVLVGADGQVKEYREEHHYSDIGEPKHRHISHLCPLYPGTLINSQQPEWVKAASKTLDLRGNRTTGWAMAHRMNCRARLGEGDKAREVYQGFIQERTVPNLWTLHPPFQIDGSLGTMAGVAEMLLQSHGGFIRVLPALPQAWNTGSFEGLVARGNFVVSAEWKQGQATAVSVLSRSGGQCRIAFPGIGTPRVKDGQGKQVKAAVEPGDVLTFATTAGEKYTIKGE